ncbi:hypothetical protein FOZ63_020788 [Perkinsus olseni]|uniref:Uncharacterized protein n=1 Tax=Perkinsus olseni TaxID=32597 RepID=A0A7J6Q3J3_PEROL|nr:hypothetical protein FOZ63_020788 [Perkinsus olseni]
MVGPAQVEQLARDVDVVEDGVARKHLEVAYFCRTLLGIHTESLRVLSDKVFLVIPTVWQAYITGHVKKSGGTTTPAISRAGESLAELVALFMFIMSLETDRVLGESGACAERTALSSRERHWSSRDKAKLLEFKKAGGGPLRVVHMNH